MEIIYLANIRLPTEKAHGLQIMKMCEAFSRAGAKLTLVIPRRKNYLTQDPYAYYGSSRSFEIIFLPALEPGHFGFRLATLSFAFSSFWWLKHSLRSIPLIYGRDALSLFLASFLTKNVFWEMHDAPSLRFPWFWRKFLQRLSGIISTNQWKADLLQKKFGAPSSKIIFYPNGFDEKEFENLPSLEGSRRILNLPPHPPIILYTGHLYDWKGAGTLLKSSRIFAEKYSAKFPATPLFTFVGGTEANVSRLKKDAASLRGVKIIGQRPHSEIPLWLRAADILVLPNSARSQESVYATSPIKLFEYLASQKPIIASDLPSIREIVSEREVFFVEPDHPEALASGIYKLLLNKDLAAQLSYNAKLKSQNYTWQERARFILNWIQERVKVKRPLA